MIRKRRSYENLNARTARLSQFDVSILGQVGEYPLIAAMGNRDATVQILLTAGMHGDEPAGPEALIRFLEQWPATPGTGITALPCLNPWGYAMDRRGNQKDKDINRSFDGSESQEANHVKEFLRGRRFSLYVDMHEDFDAVGFYLYEGQRGDHWCGAHLLNAAEAFGPIDRHVDGSDIPIEPGYYRVDPDWGTRGIVSYGYTHHTDHVLIFETPSGFPFEQRVSMQLAALRAAVGAAMNHYS